MAHAKKDEISVVRLRRQLGINQRNFWTRLGVTQSGGSRYEAGRSIPQPTQLLIELVYGTNPTKLLKQLRAKR
jgi:DNA-binding transcriptional regulator YiaG